MSVLDETRRKNIEETVDAIGEVIYGERLTKLLCMKPGDARDHAAAAIITPWVQFVVDCVLVIAERDWLLSLDELEDARSELPVEALKLVLRRMPKEAHR